MAESTTVMVVGGSQEACTRLADKIRVATSSHATLITNYNAAREFCTDRGAYLMLAVVDADLPNDEAYKLCADLVQVHKGLPVMLVSNQYSKAAASSSFEAGAVDYFAHSHRTSELAARLRAHLRSQSKSVERRFKVGPFQFEPGLHVHTKTWLTVKEARLLRRLHAADGQPVSCKELMEAGWGASIRLTHTLHTHIHRLRTKLRDNRTAQALLLSVPGGYVLSARSA